MLAIARDLESALDSLKAGRLKIRIARPIGLFQRRARSFFHATPELFIQIGGGTDFACPTENFRLRTREVCVMPSGVPHAETPVNLRTRYGVLVCMHARDGFIIQRAKSTGQSEIVASATEHLSSPRGRAGFRYLDEMSAGAMVPAGYRRDFQESLLEAFLITLLSELNRPSAADSSRSPLVTETEKLARTLLPDPELSVARLARALGCSADYLSRRFHQERGLTLTAWITRERMEIARDLLADPRRNVAEICWACGFNAPSYFIRVFRRQTGTTPRAYRMTKM
ncbi:MAG TPA: helix-turn-helix transcriptional regulator [Terrimicrobiaceae bacterium]